MAALRVHRSPVAKSASHTPSPTFTSAKSLAELTVKVLEAAWAGGASRPAASGGSTNVAATSTVARAALALRDAADHLDRSLPDVAAVFCMSCLLLFGRPLGGLARLPCLHNTLGGTEGGDIAQTSHSRGKGANDSFVLTQID